jgi:hypothetical protein
MLRKAYLSAEAQKSVHQLMWTGNFWSTTDYQGDGYLP